ncbi:MAG: HU family DNA-binding protein [Pseudomonadota bacterium]
MTTRSSKTSGAKTKTAKPAASKAATPRMTTTPKAKVSAAKAATPAKPRVTKAKTTAKPKTTASTAKTAAPKAPVATVSKLEPVVSGPDYRKKDLLDAVAAKTGMKRSDVKKVVEAALFEMGTALQDSRDLNLQPFGNVKINRERKLAEGRVLVTRIRQARDLAGDLGTETGAEPVAATVTTKAAAE